tara:strand:+ start:365 stop:781 length:417 start_codon:yes stop_codon:yes gene_type:complete
MSIDINRFLSDSASTACLELTSDGAVEVNSVVVEVASLSGAGESDNQSVLITEVVASVIGLEPDEARYVKLLWGDDSEFLHLAEGSEAISLSFKPISTGGGDADIKVYAPANTAFTLRIFMKKMTGFPLSMGHATYRA